MLRKKWIYYFLLLILPLILLFCCNLTNLNDDYFVFKILIVLTSFLFSFLSIIFHNLKKISLSRLLFVLNIILLIIYFVWHMFNKYNMLHIFSSISSFKEFILSTKEKGMMVYIFIQFIQVLSVPIPSMIITLTGVAIYGPLLGSLLCTTGVLLGSYCSFFIGKIFGFKIVSWVAGYDKAVKYANIINDRGKFFLIIAFLLPLFPDDILCLIAGITTMKFKHFFWIALITRPIGVVCMSFFGGGYIIPFTGWGLFVWPLILIVVVFLVYYSTKYQPQMEKWILNKINKLNINKKNEK